MWYGQVTFQVSGIIGTCVVLSKDAVDPWLLRSLGIWYPPDGGTLTLCFQPFVCLFLFPGQEANSLINHPAVQLAYPPKVKAIESIQYWWRSSIKLWDKYTFSPYKLEISFVTVTNTIFTTSSDNEFLFLTARNLTHDSVELSPAL